MKMFKVKSIIFVWLINAPCLIQSKKRNYIISIDETETDTAKGLEKVFGKNWKISDVKRAFDQNGDYDDDDLVESELFVMIDEGKDIQHMGKIKVK